MFIFDTDIDVEEIDDALNNQKISFFEQATPGSHPMEIEEEEEFNIEDLKYGLYINSLKKKGNNM